MDLWKKTLRSSALKMKSLSTSTGSLGTSSDNHSKSAYYHHHSASLSDSASAATSDSSSIVSPLRQLLDAVNMSILPHDLRLSSITQAAQFLDHRDRLTHDCELKEGAAFILYQKLAFAVSLEQPQHTTTHNNTAAHEIALLTSCLEMVHRASPDAIAATWYDVGEDILPLLVHVLERPFYHHHATTTSTTTRTTSSTTISSRDNKLAVQKVTKLLAMYSLVPEAKYPMVQCPGMLGVLVKILDTRHLHRARTTTSSVSRIVVMTEAARFHTLATFTNLAACEENRRHMLQTPGLVDTIARVVANERSDVARQCSALALMNLSNGDKHHVPEMASDLLLETLIALLSDEELPETRRNAAVALFNVACADENSVRVARYKEGILLEALLEILLHGEHNESCSSNAAETLFNMSCSDNKETTDRMANHPGLLETLAEVLKNTSSIPVDVKMYCAATLRRMAELIHAPMVSQGALLSSLVKASVSWTRTADIAEALEAHADVVENRIRMAEHHGLLNALAHMCGCENTKISMPAVGTIERLSREKLARPMLSNHEGIMMALTQASYEQGDDGGEGHGRLVQLALKNLVEAME